MILSHGSATLAELDAIYSLEDVFDMLEVIMVDAHNQRAVSRHYEAKGNANSN